MWSAPQNYCEAERDFLNDEYDADRLTDREYDARLNKLYAECPYPPFPD